MTDTTRQSKGRARATPGAACWRAAGRASRRGAPADRGGRGAGRQRRALHPCCCRRSRGCRAPSRCSPSTRGRFTLLLREGMEAQLAFAPGSQPVTLRGEAGRTHAPGAPGGGEGTRLARRRDAALPCGSGGAAAARPVLPPSLHDSLIRHLDWWMVGTAAASFTAHAVLMVVLRGYDPPRTPAISDFERPPVVFKQQWEPPKVPETPPPATAQAGGDRRGTRGTPPPRTAATTRDLPDSSTPPRSACWSPRPLAWTVRRATSMTCCATGARWRMPSRSSPTSAA